ncbi:hypothetical protein AUJ68_03735 [Candidatus Woesearchaeota archaeon CG1_02_57_44]|nr:MAG: hypothetical protein AUJ68_03735 [Candidatus Woesearchaeota archaeon CG1_02_57_44]PIN69844.1 MAG: hypothetical protein COV94_02420 [Candidatus Woesearchaeota archaeon CG11_big_fil_rev_8_21_14_0_20_57_5]
MAAWSSGCMAKTIITGPTNDVIAAQSAVLVARNEVNWDSLQIIASADPDCTRTANYAARLWELNSHPNQYTGFGSGGVADGGYEVIQAALDDVGDAELLLSYLESKGDTLVVLPGEQAGLVARVAQELFLHQTGLAGTVNLLGVDRLTSQVNAVVDFDRRAVTYAVGHALSPAPSELTGGTKRFY